MPEILGLKKDIYICTPDVMSVMSECLSRAQRCYQGEVTQERKYTTTELQEKYSAHVASAMQDLVALLMFKVLQHLIYASAKINIAAVYFKRKSMDTI